MINSVLKLPHSKFRFNWTNISSFVPEFLRWGVSRDHSRPLPVRVFFFFFSPASLLFLSSTILWMAEAAGGEKTTEADVTNDCARDVRGSQRCFVNKACLGGCMESEVGIYSMFFLYQKIDFLISKDIFWYQKIDFSIFWYQKIFFDIKISIFLYQKLIFWYQKIFSDIKNIFDIKNGNLFWYQKVSLIFWYQKMNFWYQKIQNKFPLRTLFFLYKKHWINRSCKSFGGPVKLVVTGPPVQ